VFRIRSLVATMICLTSSAVTWGQDTATPSVPHRVWNPETLTGALLWSAAFGLLGIVLAIFGFKLFDWVTPGDLQKEVFENKNLAAAILGAAILIGICIILAAAVHG
jgi:putative membrane protein